MGKKRILVVEDEAELVKAIQVRLGAAGYDILVAYDGQEGLSRAQKEKPDLILLDIMMPGMDGFQALEKLKKDNTVKDIPVIILTAKSQLDDVAKTNSLGALDYIVKPFESITLLQKIKKVLG